MKCTWNQDEFCTNPDCPMRGEYCPVPDIDWVCQYEDREEERYVLTPKGCFAAALIVNGIHLSDDVIDAVWTEFEDAMKLNGYVKED